MPEMTGVQMFEKAQIVQPDAIRILLTGYTDVESVIAAINNGQIYRYITKPWDPVDLEIVIKRALESYDLRQELREKNRKLEQAYSELKTLDEAKSHFMILIGHELKTPLTTINSYLSLLKEEIQNADHKKYLSRAEQGTQRLNEIVFDVLDILAGETGQVKIKTQKIKTQDYLKNLISQYDALLEKKGLQVEYSVERDSLESDENLLTKILKKIIHNAIKFSEENSHVRLGCSQAGELWVSNSGPTLTKDQIQRISQPFQIDENILHHSQGMGLGLTVCQSLLKAMGSELKIESQKNQTRVSFVVRQHPRS
jgi:signal transduction histidine kinase